jgi:1-acyl-sn-glycerol-3-phosphate acyltransferase
LRIRDSLSEITAAVPGSSPRDGAQPINDAMPVQRQATLSYRLVRLIGIPLVWLVFRVEISGRENIPAAPYVLIANHLNWLDSFLLLMAFPAEPRIHLLGDPELLRSRRLQWWIVRHVAGYIVVDRRIRSDSALFELVSRCLAVGAVLGIYPEGNYGHAEGALLPFKRGFAHFALRARVPVLPVALSGTKDLWFRKRVRVIIGRAISPDGDLAGLVARSQQQLSAILPEYREPAGPKLFRRFLTHLF